MTDWLLVIAGVLVGARRGISSGSTRSSAASARRLALAAGYLLLTVGAGVGLSFAGAAVANAAF
ncbi:hypothetical protein [Streptomyces sp. NPDC094466]|uniref:hypothetical protein n=1 Tax=Streptomyces sp. NPDC094466 TaxID=3366065 RepID=UPI0037F4A596